MPFLVSPGVAVTETDATNVIPAVSTSIGGYAGPFTWGPVEVTRTIGSESELVKMYGEPTDATARSFFTAASFLKYGNTLKVVRSLGKSGSTTHLNATTGYLGAQGLLIKSNQHYSDNYENGQASLGAWGARWPGSIGNSIKVFVCPANSTAYSGWAYKGEFTAAPGTSSAAAAGGSSNDEMHVIVVDAGGKFTGTVNAILEKYEYVSQAADAVSSDGTSSYYRNVINGKSAYIWWLDHETTFTNAGASVYSATSFATGTTAVAYTMSGGTDLDSLASEVVTAVDVFNDAETIDVNLLFANVDANGASAIANELILVAEQRKDVMAFISPAVEDTVASTNQIADVTQWASALTSSSYVVLDSTALKVYDKYNDVYRWIPACGHIAGLCANTDEVADSWWSPAGYTRGQLLGVTKLAFNPKQADRDTLYKARINPIVSFPGQGIILFGDKTALSKPSAFDRINVRRLFIVLEKAIATAAKFQLFEFNDEFTQAMFRNMTEPFLRDVQGRRGITDFKVVCDSTNNTGQVVDSNRFVADIYIKPARSINYITLNFVATRTGVAFSEIAGGS